MEARVETRIAASAMAVGQISAALKRAGHNMGNNLAVFLGGTSTL
jgi:hypothetical protein